MRSFTYKAVVSSALFFASSVAFASGDGSGALAFAEISAGIAIAIGAAGAATAQGRAASAALEGIARNPSAKADVFVPMILSLVFMEFQALLAFAVAWKLVS